METRSKQTLPIAAILSYGLPYYDEPIEVEKRPEWFKACCKYVCPGFKIDDSNKNLMNQLFLYTEGRSGKLDANKGLLLRGDIGTGKSTIMQILNRYSYFTRGKARGGYPVGGFRVDSTSGIANSFSMRGKDALELYTYNNGTPRMICFDELGREPIPAKYFGTELNVMQYISNVGTS